MRAARGQRASAGSAAPRSEGTSALGKPVGRADAAGHNNRRPSPFCDSPAVITRLFKTQLLRTVPFLRSGRRLRWRRAHHRSRPRPRSSSRSRPSRSTRPRRRAVLAPPPPGLSLRSPKARCAAATDARRAVLAPPPPDLSLLSPKARCAAATVPSARPMLDERCSHHRHLISHFSLPKRGAPWRPCSKGPGWGFRVERVGTSYEQTRGRKGSTSFDADRARSPHPGPFSRPLPSPRDNYSPRAADWLSQGPSAAKRPSGLRAARSPHPGPSSRPLPTPRDNYSPRAADWFSQGPSAASPAQRSQRSEPSAAKKARAD